MSVSPPLSPCFPKAITNGTIKKLTLLVHILPHLEDHSLPASGNLAVYPSFFDKLGMPEVTPEIAMALDTLELG